MNRYATDANREFLQYAAGYLPTASMDQAIGLYLQVLDADHVSDATLAGLGLIDRMFLLAIILNRRDALKPWLYDRCREVEANPDGQIDLWAREHYKSTLITYTGIIQNVLRDPNQTIGLFSHTRPIAKGFLRQIKVEFETNDKLKRLYSDVLYSEPRKQSPKWSEDDGITVKRTQNPKEATIEAWGLVDGQPTSKHFNLLVYDDVVTKESVSNPDMIKKVTEAWELSLNLGAHGGRRWTIGTRYHANDTYRTMLDRGSVLPRIYPATNDGTEIGEPVFLDRETLRKKRRDMGPYTFAAQMLQNPTADKSQGFRREWLQYWRPDNWRGMNRYILVDPASKKKKSSDYTVMAVIGLASDRNYYVIDWIRDRLNLTGRAKKLFELHRKYRPQRVGYEEYGAQADIEHIKFVQELENYRFEIKALGGSLAKDDRIRGLVPIFEQGRMFLPNGLCHLDYEQHSYDPTEVFTREEYGDFPVCAHDDMFDDLARIIDPDLDVTWPEEIIEDEKPDWLKKIAAQRAGGGFMGR